MNDKKIGVGFQVGRLTVQAATPQRKNGYTVWECCCECGGEVKVNTKRLEPLESRVDYIPGAGQLCRRCAAENMSGEQTARRNDFVYELPYYQKLSDQEETRNSQNNEYNAKMK